MKRPEGFDGAPRTAPAQPPARRMAGPRTVAPKPTSSAPTSSPKAPQPQKPAKPAKPDTAAAAREARKAAAARRRYERGEVRRFTRRTRRRRVTLLVVAGFLVLLVGLVVGAIYSPLLSLRTIQVTGTSRVDPKQIEQALHSQIGTPLALVDFSAIRTALAKYPLIRSYVTESVPPDTLVIRITERSPIAVIQTAQGFSVVDPAGVVLDNPSTRPANLPMLSGSAALSKNAAFAASVQVLLALPAAVLSTVDSVTAQTTDDVTFTLTGGQKVVWGSDEQSDVKARVLADLIKNEPAGAAVTFNVSSPTTPVISNG